MTVLFLEELAKLPFDDLDTFGEKSRGSWILSEIRRRTGRNEDGIPLFIQDPKYHLSEFEPIDSKDSLAGVMEMARTPIVADAGEVLFSADEPKILLARSSAMVEFCGEYHSGFFYADPANPELTIQGWLREARKVRESGAGPMIIDALYGQKINLAEELQLHNKQVRQTNPNVKRTIQPLIDAGVQYVIGVRDFSFVGKTSSALGKINSVTMAAGLATKIVRGDEDVTTMFSNSRNGIQYFDEQTSYYEGNSSINRLPNVEIDVVTIEATPQQVSLPYNMFTQAQTAKTHLGVVPIPFFGDIRFYDLILDAAKLITGKEVEIEGAWNGADALPHVFQLRTYDVPESKVVELREPSVSQVIVEKTQSVISGRYEGHFVIANELFRESDLAFEVRRPYYMMPENKEFAKKLDLSLYPNCGGVVFPFFKPVGRGHANLHAHSVGLALQLINGVNKDAMALSIDPAKIHSSCGLDQKYTYHRELFNVVIESDGVQGQIYHAL